MEIQVQELLERIRSEGIETAKQQAEEIIQKAQSEASEIVSRAKKEAEEVQDEASRRIDSMEAASRASLLQASRDTMIALKQSIQRFIDAAISVDVDNAFDEKMAIQVIPEVLKALALNQSVDTEILLPPALIQKIDASLSARLAKELSKGVTFKPYPSIDAGFRVAQVGSAAQYDFSAESLAQILSARVNSLLSEYLKEASGSLE
ncbi:putative V-type ATP synthase subunit E [uncultured spirochete]|jgi:V/A-type H+-transporting ATPase subunit E|uniref:Putative V-type ATP synthase subunit E n=1 Tax=uncultured spirochete TaxID=156406 RepID=A0A3P3XU02_9SPIR|nr:putative V-type ATP synthase subunit E [uncultured spirochete]